MQQFIIQTGRMESCMVFKNWRVVTSQPVNERVHYPINFKFDQTSRKISYPDPVSGNATIEEWWNVHNSNRHFLIYVSENVYNYIGKIYLCQNGKRQEIAYIIDDEPSILWIISSKKLSRKSKMFTGKKGQQLFETPLIINEDGTFTIEELLQEFL